MMKNVSFQYSIKPPKGVAKEIPESVADPSTKKNSTTILFENTSQRFVTLLQMLWKYTHEIGAIAESTSLSNFASMPVLIKELTERHKKASVGEAAIAELHICISGIDENGEEKISKIEVPIYEYNNIEKIREYQRHNDAALTILNETAIQQLVNAWEKLLGDLLSWYLQKNPDAAARDKTISFSEILQYHSFDEVRNKVIDKEVEDFLKRKDTTEQLNYMRDELKADLSTHFPLFPHLKEIVLRRHAIVHAGGVATGEYLRKARKIKGLNVEECPEGSPLKINAKYVTDSWNCIYAAGVILMHIVAKNVARINKSTESEARADEFLLRSAFSNIENMQYDSAKLILEYANKNRLSEDTSNLIAKVNLAQTYKWMGNEVACEKILSSTDWNACNSLFQLCVNALRDNYAEFVQLLPEVIRQKKITIKDVYEWPVFQLVRKAENFDEAVEAAFGEKKPRRQKAFDPKILNFTPEKTLEELQKFISLDMEIEPNTAC